ncbi:MAG: hypothetical protein NC293_03040 [Roseburia sp.]|nr:hypothetical protein [Roseburia sp.]
MSMKIVDNNYGSDELVQDMLANNPLGVLLIQGNNVFLDTLAANTSYKDRQGIYGNGSCITIHLCPVYYTHIRGKDTNLIEYRTFALMNLYDRWCKVLSRRKKNAKSCFSSKAFNDYLDRIEYMKSDYIIFMVD